MSKGKGNLRWRLAQAFEYRWWERYLGQRPPEEYLAWKKNYWYNLLDQINVQPLQGAKVLDAGCGPAGIFMVMPQCEVTALDPLLKKYQKWPHFKGAARENINFLAIPLEKYAVEERFDLVCCLNAINHVSDLNQCLDILVDAVKPGGQLLISTDAHKSTFWQKVFHYLPGDIMHPHQYTAEMYHKKFAQRGLRLLNHITRRSDIIFDYQIWLWEKP